MQLREIGPAFLCLLFFSIAESLLYPRDSESRTAISLNGLWNFRLSPPRNNLLGFNQKWYSTELKKTGATIQMVVPASFNDLTLSKEIRDHCGVVWYDRTFYIPNNWNGDLIWLRFGSVCHWAQVWVNGVSLGIHEIGHLPFDFEITKFVHIGKKNLVTVAVDNTLLATTVPQGYIYEYKARNKTVIRQGYTFDFYNYAGIDRPVWLYRTPVAHIKDISVTPEITKDGDKVKGKLQYEIFYEENLFKNVTWNITLFDMEQNAVASANMPSGEIEVDNVKLWWPYLMDKNPAYLYELEVVLIHGQTRDVYRQKVGFRSIRWTNKQILLNDKPLYIRGIGKHEDSDIKGKGLDMAVVLRDFELMKWLGVNTFRTSHYPYADEIMDLADEMGFMVIDECPSVDTDNFPPELLKRHKVSLTELIMRDKNRPSVIMWSVANEPRTQSEKAKTYFEGIIEHVKSLDNTRPVTLAVARSFAEDKSGQFLDVICFNRYNGWYSNPGKEDTIINAVMYEAEMWHKTFNKPVVMCEYGAAAYVGLHALPGRIWSEEYQEEILQEHFKAFDLLRQKGFFIGEMIWNFADFRTKEEYTRVSENRKGIFTRERNPKAAAFYVRARYNELARKLDGAQLPSDLYKYLTPEVQHM